eukprot:2532933-Amphidinium_carterae.1
MPTPPCPSWVCLGFAKKISVSRLSKKIHFGGASCKVCPPTLFQDRKNLENIREFVPVPCHENTLACRQKGNKMARLVH